MREILFRGKAACGAWVQGDLINRKIWYSEFKVIRAEDSGFDNYIEYEVITETIGQYTGLTDKNGKKIFEGDNVQAFLPATVVQREFAWPVMQVVFSRGAFGLSDSRGEVTPFRSFSPRVEFEVVGNVFDEGEE